jgi:hypothetical protein
VATPQRLSITPALSKVVESHVTHRCCVCSVARAGEALLRPFAALLLPENSRLTEARNEKVPASGDFEDGSDGTRTRDLRRDRPIRVQRRLPTSNLERVHLQGVCVFPPELGRMVA